MNTEQKLYGTASLWYMYLLACDLCLFGISENSDQTFIAIVDHTKLRRIKNKDVNVRGLS